MEKEIWKESVSPCYICGKVWKREDFEKWFFFSDLVICKDHPGAEEWYKGALEMNAYKSLISGREIKKNFKDKVLEETYERFHSLQDELKSELKLENYLHAAEIDIRLTEVLLLMEKIRKINLEE